MTSQPLQISFLFIRLFMQSYLKSVRDIIFNLFVERIIIHSRD